MRIGLQTWGTTGDIRPFLALAGGLRSRGHQVTLVITSVENKEYSSYAASMDFALIHAGRFDLASPAVHCFLNRINSALHPIQQSKIILETFYHPVQREMFEAAEHLCKENDLIIGHFVHYAVQAAAEKAGKPYATVMLNHLGIPSKNTLISGAPDFGKWINPAWWKLYSFLINRLFQPELDRFRRKLGLPPVKSVTDTVMAAEKLNLIAVSPVFCTRQPDWDGRHQVSGFLALPRQTEAWAMPDDLMKFLEIGPPPVFMTFGSMFSHDMAPRAVMESMMKAALQAGCRAIVQAPWDGVKDTAEHPDILRIGTVPHSQVFPYCSAIVHHGGAGTTHTATLHGCPSIVIEHLADQGFFAGELERLGIAPKALHRRNVTTRKLTKAIRTVLGTPAMKNKAEELGTAMNKENGVRTAVDMIEKTFGGS
jgi:sterol 3beta-glucosyltransferase